MNLSDYKPERITHIRKTIEIAGIIFQAEDFLSSAEILNLYSRNFKRETSIEETSVKRSVHSIHSILGFEVIESKPSKGYRLKAEYKKNRVWMLPLLSQYLFFIDGGSLNFSLESLPFQLESDSLYKLFIFNDARERNKPVEFTYIKYLENTVKKKRIQVYSILLRGRKLFILGKDLNAGDIRHYIFTQVREILQVDEETDLAAISEKSFQDLYKDSLEAFEGLSSRKVVLRFSKEAEIYIQKEYFHSSQRFFRNEENELFMEMNINYSEELFALLGRFLNCSELIEPADWREEYISRLKKALQLHKKTHSVQ